MSFSFLNSGHFLNIAQGGWVSHPILMVLEAIVIAAAFSLFDRRPARERAYYALYVFSGLIGTAVAAGWLMRLIARAA